jgi:hypothetical protein
MEAKNEVVGCVKMVAILPVFGLQDKGSVCSLH